MRARFVFFCVGLISVWFAGDIVALHLLSKPKSYLGIEPAQIDLGTHRQGDLISAKCVLRNDATVPLSITSVQPECGCTKAQLTEKLLESGKTSEMDINLSIGENRGDFTKKIVLLYRLEGKDIDQFAIVNLACRSIPDYEISPTSLAFAQQKSATQEIDFVPIEKSVGIVDTWSTHPEVSVALSSEGSHIQSTYSGRNAINKKGEIIVITNSVRQPKFVIPVQISSPKIQKGP